MNETNTPDPKPGESSKDPWSATGPRSETPKMSDGLSRDTIRELEAVIGRRVDALTTDNENLRKQLRLSQIGLGLVFLVTVAIAFLAAPRAAGVEETVQSKQFVLRDETGLIRGLWEMDAQASAPRMILRDRDGRERVRFGLLADGSPGITLGDREGRPRVVLGILPDGTSNLVFADAGGTTRAVLGHSSADATTLVLADREGFTRAGLVVDDQGEGTLTLYERGDRTNAQAMEPAAEMMADLAPPAEDR